MTGRDHAVESVDETLLLEDEIAHLRQSDAKVLISIPASSDAGVVARSIHQRSPRAARAFVTVNCAGVSESRLEQELFGGRPGGAARSALELADRGTLFLDEIGDMTPRMQALLAQFLETGEVPALGTGNRVDVRLIAATRRDLRDHIERGRFREDLFYRLNVVHIVLRPRHE